MSTQLQQRRPRSMTMPNSRRRASSARVTVTSHTYHALEYIVIDRFQSKTSTKCHIIVDARSRFRAAAHSTHQRVRAASCCFSPACTFMPPTRPACRVRPPCDSGVRRTEARSRRVVEYTTAHAYRVRATCASNDTLTTYFGTVLKDRILKIDSCSEMRVADVLARWGN